jgi:hypothetical protein
MTKLTLGRFTLSYILYCTFIGGIAFILPFVLPQHNLLATRFWMMFGFLSGITFIAYSIAYFGIKHNPETGTMAIMGAIVVKMLFSLAFVLIFSIKGVEKPVIFALNFFSLYLLLTVFEISSLLRNLRHQNK